MAKQPRLAPQEHQETAIGPEAETPPLRIYTDRKYLAPRAAQVPLLAPVWGAPHLPPSHPDIGLYEPFARTGERIVALIAPDEAEAFVLPGYWMPGEKNLEARQMAQDAKRAGKPLLVFFLSDSEEPIPLNGAIIFRTSFRRSRRKANTHALAAPGVDLVERHCGGELPLRVKADRPKVSFCGSTIARDEHRRNRLRAFVYWTRSFIRPRQYGPWLAADFGQRIRMEAMESLAASSRVATSFIARRGFLNGIDMHDPAEQEKSRQSRLEYVENLLDSDYVLCPRGTGNFSFRFYETLCCGRIPIVIDTDCPLPYDKWIDWREHCVWVPQSEIARTGDYVAEFHARLTPETFLERQRAARDLWLKWLSPEGFHANLYRYLR